MNIINSNSIIILEKVQIYGIVKKKKVCIRLMVVLVRKERGRM